VSDLVDILKILTGKRFPFKFVYANEYWMFNPGRHVFPIKKYRLIYESLLEIGARPEHFIEPRPASDEELLLVHTPRFLKKIETSSLNRNELQELELRFSPELVRFSRLMVGGTILTLEQALSDGLAVHIGGGFHHAFPDHGEGFCLLNDVAVAVESAVRAGRAKKVMIIDCDLHQGNGTAAVFAGREDVFTFSIHQMDIYPSTKPAGTLDVGLWSGDGDENYLAELGAHIPRIYEEFHPDLVVYLAGADPFEGDQLGGLFLTKAGLKARDKLVLVEARSRRIPVAVLLAGGYAADIRDTVDIHLNTIRAARVAQRLYS
jgi:acetoin utilization deacetylase AcuC-like enzyme